MDDQTVSLTTDETVQNYSQTAYESDTSILSLHSKSMKTNEQIVISG